MKRKILTLSAILPVLLGLFAWSPWITEEIALRRVGAFIGNCRFSQAAVVGRPNYFGAFVERTWFGLKVWGWLECPPDYNQTTKAYFVSPFGRVNEIKYIWPHDIGFSISPISP